MAAAGKKLWYVPFQIQGEWDWKGPFTTSEIGAQITRRELAWSDFIYTPDSRSKKAWERVCDLEEFGEDPFLNPPKAPPQDLLREIERATREHKIKTPTHERAIWFLKNARSIFGPLTGPEVTMVMKSGKLKGETFIRRSGSANWKPAERTLPLITRAMPAPPPETRRSPRRAVIATVQYIPSGQKKTPKLRTGVCRDISTKGMMILSQNHPVFRGTILQLQVQPNPESGLSPFKTEAIVVWTDPAESAFSVEFRNLPFEASMMIQRYIRSKT